MRWAAPIRSRRWTMPSRPRRTPTTTPWAECGGSVAGFTVRRAGDAGGVRVPVAVDHRAVGVHPGADDLEFGALVHQLQLGRQAQERGTAQLSADVRRSAGAYRADEHVH